MNPPEAPTQPARPARTRRISKRRVALAVVVAGAIAATGVYVVNNAVDEVSAVTTAPWFAGYVDVTLTPGYSFEAPADSTGNNVVLSFIVSDPTDACTPSWGAAYSMDEAASQLDLDRRIARLEGRGGEAIVSFGGQANDELAVRCSNAAQLQKAYASVIERYSLTTIDLDLEGASLSDSAAMSRRATAIANLQTVQRAAGSDLAVWLTLPVTPQGLATAGTDAVAAFLAAGVDLAGVNAMTMDYGQSKPATDSMLTAATDALTATHRQLRVLYSAAQIDLTDATLWHKIGATPMIGQNDVSGEVFTLDDAAKLNAWGTAQGITRMSMWSLNRDATCGSSFTDVNRVSNFCSGVDQGDTTFSALLGADMPGTPQSNSMTTTTPEALPEVLDDNPATSPYQIWNENATYLAETKVVWHHNVYQAKWWTRGDLPDDAVLDEFETPWTLIGPVMPGETPIPIPTLPAGTYAEWDGTSIYEKGSRVLFQGIPFEAKWWTQGDSPEASSTNPDNSPWIALTTEQIQQILDGTLN
jgi:chitinase